MLMLAILLGMIALLMPTNSLTMAFKPDDKWPLTSSNSNITDTPTLKDFVPLGIEFIKTQDNELKWNGLKWRLSCFIFVGMGKTMEGKPFIFQIRIPPSSSW